MTAQSQILRTLRVPHARPRLERILSDEALRSRYAIGHRVCQEFGFHDVRGHPQKATCLNALRTLDAEGLVTLPAPKRSVHGRRPCVLDAPVPEPVAVPPVVKQIEGPEIIMVGDAQQRALWNTLLHYEHPVGTTMFAGAQIRYLFRSVHGYLGAIGFSASALHLAPREKWMAWSEAQRKACLNRVVGLSGDMAGAHPGRISTSEEWPTSGA